MLILVKGEKFACHGRGGLTRSQRVMLYETIKTIEVHSALTEG